MVSARWVLVSLLKFQRPLLAAPCIESFFWQHFCYSFLHLP